MKKINMVLVFIIILFFIIGINTVVTAKYFFEYKYSIGNINIDRRPPKANVNYSTIEPTGKNVTVTIEVDEDIQEVEGWSLSQDKRHLTKEYEENQSEIVEVKDLAGNTKNVEVNVKNIDKEKPYIELIKINNSNSNKKANYNHELIFRIKIIEKNIIENNLNAKNVDVKIENNITSPKNLKVNKISQEEDGIIYDIVISGIYENGKLSIVIKDSIIMDIGNLYNDKKVIESQITLDNSVSFTYASHNSKYGWSFGYGNGDIAGLKAIKDNAKYKTEALAFNVSGGMGSDFIKSRAYIYTHWGTSGKGKCSDSGMIYLNGYNPSSTKYKSMKSTDLVDIEGKKYFQFGGKGINKKNSTDINGKNPIPEDVAITYPYGICGILFELKDYSYYSIVYQIYIEGVGWLTPKSDGEECIYSKKKPMSAIRISVIPKTQKSSLITKWKKD